MEPRAYTPALLGVALALGVWIGSGFQDPFLLAKDDSQWQKIEQILQYVENDYVDTIQRKDLEEEIVTFLLQKLDPHSYYISEAEVASMNEPMEGNFEGIGVQFKLERDTIYVIKALVGGPSIRAGVLEGDRIVIVNEDTVAGTGLTNKMVMSLLKGPAGSDVSIGVKRRGSSEITHINVTRGQIPIRSVEAAYLVDSTTIYVRLARFAKNTYEEFQEAAYPLLSDNTTHFILDLRGNGGGILDASINLVDEFLSEGKLITYTQGRSRPRSDFLATEKGMFEDLELIVLIDGYSASASEIVAGAIQDHNRGVIVGRRSFGKGLVQEQNEWSDGSATRLTVARYYTPNGRSIQRPYESIALHEPVNDLQADTSTHGGIVPNVLVKRDTAGVTWFYAELVHRGYINDFAYSFRDKHLATLRGLTKEEFIHELQLNTIAEELRAFLNKRDFEINESEWARSIDLVTIRCKSIIGRSMFDDETYWRIANETDPFVREALEIKQRTAT